MMNLNIKHILAVSGAIKPIMETMMNGSAPKPIGNLTTIKKLDNDEGWAVICIVKFKTEDEAKKFKQIDEKIDEVTSTLQK